MHALRRLPPAHPRIRLARDAGPRRGPGGHPPQLHARRAVALLLRTGQPGRLRRDPDGPERSIRVEEAAAFVRARGFDGRFDAAFVLGTASARSPTRSTTRSPLAYAEIPHFPRERRLRPCRPARRRHASKAGACCCSRAARTTTRPAMPAPCACRSALVRRARRSRRSSSPTRPARCAPEIRPGSLVAISDHLNLSGANPLLGDHADGRFVSLTDAYDPGLRAALQARRGASRPRRCRRASMPGSPGRASRRRPRSAWCRSSAATSSACRRCRRSILGALSSASGSRRSRS